MLLLLLASLNPRTFSETIMYKELCPTLLRNKERYYNTQKETKMKNNNNNHEKRKQIKLVKIPI